MQASDSRLPGLTPLGRFFLASGLATTARRLSHTLRR